MVKLVTSAQAHICFLIIRLMSNQSYKVFGVGFPRSGSSSLKTALREMGFKTGGVHHIYDPDVNAHVGDWICMPNNRYKDLDEEFPNAQFILTERKDAVTWYESVVRRGEQAKHSEGIERQRKSMYGSPTPIKSLYLAKYYRRSSDIRSYFQGKYGEDYKKNLLTICFESNSGDENWDILASFLGCTYPDKPFPHRNKSPKK